MGGKRIYFSIILHFLLLQWCQSNPGRPALESRELVRVRRQDGYVYDKPNKSFDLPSRPSLQAPTVDRTQAQQMYYAYPAPASASGDAVNIGYSSTAATTASSGSSVASGYNYGAQGGAIGTQVNSGLQAAFGAQTSSNSQSSSSSLGSFSSQGSINNGKGSFGYNYNAPVEISSDPSRDGNSGSSGYNYNTPTTTSPVLTTSTAPVPRTEVSTNAPRYLPPQSSIVGAVNTGSVSIETSGPGPDAVQPPSDSYLPPLIVTNTQTPLSNVQGSTNTQPASGPIQVPNAGYIPPIPARPLLSSTNSGSNTPGTPPTGYLPPITSSGSLQGSVSAPSSVYLPPIS